MTLEVIEFDEDTAAARPFKVTTRVASGRSRRITTMPQNGEDRLAETAAGVMTINKDDFRSDNVFRPRSARCHRPARRNAASLLGRGKRVTMRGENDVVLADIIIGSEIEGREGFHFVRVPEQKRVYAAKVDVDIFDEVRGLDRERPSQSRAKQNGPRRAARLFHQREDSHGG